MSTEDLVLKEVKEEIEDLKSEIKAYKARIPENEVTLDKHVDYLTTLHKDLVELRKKENSLLTAKAPSTTSAQQGSRLFHFLIRLLY
jgi:uncharacterized coiled-coil DUF342 family protein